MKNLGVPEGFTQFSYVTGHQGWTLSFANLCDVDSSEGSRMLVQKEEVTRLRWLRKEMALGTWGLQKQKKGVKKVMGGKKDVGTTSAYPNFLIHSMADSENCSWHRKQAINLKSVC